MTTLEALKIARGRIELGWTQGCYARGPAGLEVRPNSELAACWCSVGALRYAFGISGDEGVFCPDYGTANLTLTKTFRRLYPLDSSVPEWQDEPERTKEDVLALYDAAIADEEARNVAV